MIGAVDIGGTKIAVGMVDNNGRVLSRTERPTESGRGYSGALARIIAMLQETAREARAEITGNRHRLDGNRLPLHRRHR